MHSLIQVNFFQNELVKDISAKVFTEKVRNFDSAVA